MSTGCAVLLVALTVLVPFRSSGAEEPKAAPAPAPVMEQRALDLLRRMSDRLAAAKAFTFRARSSIEVPATTGQLLDFFTTSDVAVGRPNRLHVSVTGDHPAFQFYYDGKTVTASDPGAHLYAVAEAPGTLDDMLEFVMNKGGLYFPFVDVLMGDPYAAMTKGITSAFVAGRTDIGGVMTEHLAFAGPGIEWQAWIEVEKALPRLLAVTYTDLDREPHFQVAFSDWNLAAKPSPASFAFKAPAEAKRIELRAIAAGSGVAAPKNGK